LVPTYRRQVVNGVDRRLKQEETVTGLRFHVGSSHLSGR